jgi:hypothetical protein
MYKIIAILAGLPNLLAGFVWLFNPMAVLVLWGVDDSSHELVVERRLGVVLLSIGLMLLLSRNAAPSPARSAISYGMIVGAFGVLAVNAYDLMNDQVSSGIIAGMGLNLFTALAFIAVEWQSHRQAKSGSSKSV